MNKRFVISLICCLVAVMDLMAFDGSNSQSGSGYNDGYTLQVTGETTVVQQTAEVLRKRLVAYGIDTPEVNVDNGHIVVKIPAQEDQGSIKMLLESVGDLGFFDTYDGAEFTERLRKFAAKSDIVTRKRLAELLDLSELLPHFPVVGYALPGDTVAINRIINTPEVKSSLPADLKLAWSAKESANIMDKVELVALRTVNGSPSMDGSTIISATSGHDYYGGNIVIMSMNDEGARQWSRMTKRNIARTIAIVVDDKVYCHPLVNSQIDGGMSSISSNYTAEESKCMAAVLQGGKLPAAVKILPQK